MELPPGVPFTLDAREACLYALGVGAGRQPVFAGAAERRCAVVASLALSSWCLSLVCRRYVYEGDPRFVALPTLAATFPFRGAAPGEDPVLGALAAAGLRFEPSALLHGEQSTRLHAPLASALRGAPLRNATRVEAVLDKGSGALVVMRTDTRLADGALLATNTQSVFIRGLGGFAPRAPGQQPADKPAQAPRRPPDAVWLERVDPAAALLYRLSGDTNPLHADPAAAARGGFDAPILHGACADACLRARCCRHLLTLQTVTGLCTLGYAVRAVLLRLCDGDAARVTRVRVRFSGVVFPGDTLETSLWRDGPLRVAFQARTLERGKPALSGGVLELAPPARL